MSRALGRDHDDIEIRARLDLAIVDIETMRKRQRRALLDIRKHLLAVQRCLMFIRSQDHDHVGGGHCFGNRLDHESRRFGLGYRPGPGTQTDDDLDTRIFQVVGMRMPLRTIADDRYFFTFYNR